MRVITYWGETPVPSEARMGSTGDSPVARVPASLVDLRAFISVLYLGWELRRRRAHDALILVHAMARKPPSILLCSNGFAVMLPPGADCSAPNAADVSLTPVEGMITLHTVRTRPGRV